MHLSVSGFTLLFEAMLLTLAQQIPFVAVAVGESWHRVHAICKHYVGLALAVIDVSDMTSATVDETSYKRGHNYLTLGPIPNRAGSCSSPNAGTPPPSRSSPPNCKRTTPRPCRSPRLASTCRRLHQGRQQASHQGRQQASAQRRITIDKFHVVTRASFSLAKRWRHEQKTDLDLKGLRWALLKDCDRPSVAQRADLDALWSPTSRPSALLVPGSIASRSTCLLEAEQRCINVMRSKVEPMKEVACMIRKRFDGIIVWTQTRQTNGFLEALNGLF
ncbi:transposase [Burkholderia ubonensis]|uniref:transposase n=1 Tax=Burkholderia ubonensis TaxID=101571 RepID=UPI001E48DF1E|nr:transposase [Burkholderia ubonensis]